MKINKQQFVQLMKEAYNKRLVTEDGEEQGETLVGNNPPADVVAVVRAVNARLQGKAEYLTASQAFLEYLLEWSEEGAVLGDLQTVCNELMEKSKMKGAGNQLFTALKRASEIYRQGKAAKVAREPGQAPGNRPENVVTEVSKEAELEGLIAQVQAMNIAMTPQALDAQWKEAEKAGVPSEMENSWKEMRKKHLEDARDSYNADALRLQGQR